MRRFAALVFLVALSGAPGHSATGSVFLARREAACPEDVQFFDGFCNNLARPDLGAANTPYRRGPEGHAFADGVSEPRAGPNAQHIAHILGDDDTIHGNGHGFTIALPYFGQFVAHDIAFTRGADAEELGEDAVFKVPVLDEDDPLYGDGSVTINVAKSFLDTEDGYGNPLNEFTHFLDLGMVYGHDYDNEVARMRAGEGGRLKVMDYHVADEAVRPGVEMVLTNQLPNVNGTGIAMMEDLKFNNPPNSHLKAGGPRAPENAGLLMFHLLFHREHNRIADALATVYPGWSDEELFLAARSWNIAYYQHIVFDEYLRALIGEFFYQAAEPYPGYNPDIDPSVSVLYVSAAGRFGHSLIPEKIPIYGKNGGKIDEIPLSGLFYGHLNPLTVNLISRGPGTLARSMMMTGAHEVDGKMVHAMRNFPGPFSIYAANIVRGRLNGVPSYSDVAAVFSPEGGLYTRRGCVGHDEHPNRDPLACFRNVGRSVAESEKLREAYHKVGDIDAWVGFIHEGPAAGSAFGPTLTAVIVDQYMRLRGGDRFWYENRMNPADIATIKARTLTGMIADNFDVPVESLPPFAFRNQMAV